MVRVIRRQKRWKRSFLRRQGNISKAQKRAIRELWPVYGTRFWYGDTLNFDVLFQRKAPVVVEIGFGHGATLLATAAHRPEINVFGIEVHRPALGATLLAIERAQVANVRLLRGDVLEVFQDYIKPGSIEEVNIFFPDPWLDDRDKDRRLIRPHFLDLLSIVLKADGIVRLATDIQEYAESCSVLFAGHPAFCVRQRPPMRPTLDVVSNYEAKGLKAGRAVWDIEFRRLPGHFVELED